MTEAQGWTIFGGGIIAVISVIAVWAYLDTTNWRASMLECVAKTQKHLECRMALKGN